MKTLKSAEMESILGGDIHFHCVYGLPSGCQWCVAYDGDDPIASYRLCPGSPMEPIW